MPDNSYAQIEAIHETFSSIKSLWMRLVSMAWDINTGNQLFYQSKKLNTLVDGLNQTENHDQLNQTCIKISQCCQLIKSSGNITVQQGNMTRLFKDLVNNLPEQKKEKADEPKIEKIKSSEVLLVSSLSEILSKQLKKSGFASRSASSLEQAAFLLTSGMPRAIVIDLTCFSKEDQTSEQSGIQIIELFNKIRDTLPPVIFLSGKDSLENRINTIKAGAIAYLPDPVNMSTLVNKLKKGLTARQDIPDKRILMIDNNDKEKRIFNQAMEYAFDARILTDSNKILNSLKIYRPELIVMNMELVDTNGYFLYLALKQHPLTEDIPIILIAKQESISDHLDTLDRRNLDLLIQPVNPEYLIWSIQQRIYQIHHISDQIQKIDKKDKLTGLLNRHYFLKKMKEVLHPKNNSFNGNATLILIMIDNIDEIRTKTDAARADEIIMLCAQSFKQSVQVISKKISLQARFTDNTFSLLCLDSNEEEIKSCATELINKLELSGQSLDAKHADIEVKACIGVSSFQSQPPKDYLALIDQAKIALIRAQKKADDRIHILDPDSGLSKISEVSESVIEKINYAFENGLLKLFFQAISGFEQDAHKRYEACLRIYEEDGSEIDSNFIFSAIEDHPLNYILDCWVIEQSIRLLLEKEASDRESIDNTIDNETPLSTTLFINISPRTLQEDDFMDCYKEILTSYNMSSFQFVFEISQDTLINYHEVLYEVMKSFKDSGCYFSLQHYEGGKQANALLKELDFDYIKISNNWLEESLSQPDSEQNLKNFIAEMNSQNITLIASEIESIQILPAICTSGIKYVQGHFLHHPSTKIDYDFSHGIF